MSRFKFVEFTKNTFENFDNDDDYEKRLDQSKEYHPAKSSLGPYTNFGISQIFNSWYYVIS